jgi:hypothetical protein
MVHSNCALSVLFLNVPEGKFSCFVSRKMKIFKVITSVYAAFFFLNVLFTAIDTSRHLYLPFYKYFYSERHTVCCFEYKILKDVSYLPPPAQNRYLLDTDHKYTIVLVLPYPSSHILVLDTPLLQHLRNLQSSKPQPEIKWDEGKKKKRDKSKKAKVSLAFVIIIVMLLHIIRVILVLSMIIFSNSSYHNNS